MANIIYTAITGGYDEPRDDIKVLTYDKFKNEARNARTCKILFHKFLKLNEGDIVVWLDGNIYLKEPIDFLGNADIGVFKHPYWDYEEEFNRARDQVGLQEDILIGNQKEAYEMKGILAETGVLVRRNTKKVREFCEKWFIETVRWSYRDQLSFTKVANESDVKIKYNEGNVRNHPAFIYKSHVGRK